MNEEMTMRLPTTPVAFTDKLPLDRAFDTAEADVLARNNAKATELKADNFDYYATADCVYPDGKPYLYRFPINAGPQVLGEVSFNGGGRWSPSERKRRDMGRCGYVTITSPTDFSQPVADKCQQILALFDTLTEKEQQNFVASLWDGDNKAFSDDLCERIKDDWRRGRGR